MSSFEDKYHLTSEQSIFLAKKKWDENVYCGMKMENRAVTFPQTQTILNGVNVPNVQLDDIQAILNMRDAWKYLLHTVEELITFAYWCKLNEYIARNEALEWGIMLANKILISAGAGIMTITDKYMEQFNVVLLKYYNTGKPDELKQFIYENAIHGINL